jgi:hypothetical protein
VAAPYWAGLRDGVLLVQRCAALRHLAVRRLNGCATTATPGTPAWVEVAAGPHLQLGTRLAPGAPSLKDHGPYLAVVVDLPHAGGAHGGQPAGRPDAAGADRR